MAVPSYLGFAQMPSPVQAGIATAGQLQNLAARRQAMQQQAALAPLQLQQEQEAVREQPLAFAQQQQTRQMQQHAAAQQLAASQLHSDQLRHNIVRNDLADIYAAPKDQQDALFAQKRKQWLKMGADPDILPTNYDAMAQTEAKNAYNNSSAVANQRKTEADLMKTILSGRMAIQTAQVKAQAARAGEIPPQQKAFQTAEGQKNSAYFDTINTNADKASEIYNQTVKMIGTAGQIPNDMGLIKGGKVYLTPKGRELLANSRQMVLKMFANMPHVGRGGNLLQKNIMGSKPSVSMPYQTYVNIAKWYQASSALAMEKNQMAQVLKQRGITDRNQINNIWDRFQEAYPISDAQGNVVEGNVKKWPEFLQSNPQVLTGFAGGVQASSPPSIAGKKLPGTVGSVGGTQTVPTTPATTTQPMASTQTPLANQQGTPATQSPYYTAYNPYTGIGGQ